MSWAKLFHLHNRSSLYSDPLFFFFFLNLWVFMILINVSEKIKIGSLIGDDNSTCWYTSTLLRR